jgi:hypothetical protein
MVEEFARQLPQGYSLAIVGPVGIGETKVKFALMPDSIGDHQNSMWFLDRKSAE